MKAISLKLKFSGIYCIINIKNNKRYVGSSRNVSSRLWCHRSELRNNKHDNQHLQNAWNKYGEQMFDYYILEKCEESKLQEREQYYITSLNPEYNIIKDIIRNEIPEETKRKMSESRIKGFEKGTVKCYQNKEIWQYDLEGNFIKKYDNIKHAAIETGVNRSNINRYLSGIYKKGGNFLWSLDGNIPEPYIKPKRLNENQYKPLKVTDVEGNIMIFNSFKEAAEFFNVSSPVISYVVKKGNLYKQKYKIELYDCRISK
jgi:predicted GIY-YIG superfamily endonuclease